MNANKVVSAGAVLAILCTSATVPANAQLQGGVSKGKAVTGTGTYLQRHPKVKGATVGAAVGTGAGAVTGLLSGKGIMRGAAIGAGTGAGVGLLQTSQTMKRHTIIKDGLIGTTAGLGLGMAASRGHGTGKNAAKAAAVGGALGLGFGFLKKKL